MVMDPRRDAPGYTADWQEWLAENLLREIDVHKIISAMEEHGFYSADVRSWIAAQQAAPAFRAARRLQVEHRKLRSLTDALSDQWSRSPTATTVPVMDPPDEQAFFEHYYFANRPLIVRGLVDNWPALHIWSPEFFATTFGDSTIEIAADRNSDSRFEDNFAEHRREITMREFATDVMRGAGNDRYLVAKNQLLQRPEFRRLLDDIRQPCGFLDPAALHESAKLWFGPRGTLTPFHHDACNILFVQVHGSKLVRLVEPHDLPRVYNDRECFSPVDLDDVDLAQFPWMATVRVAEATVRPGDALLIPLGWWHWVKSLEPSISVSFTGFALPDRPTIWRYS